MSFGFLPAKKAGKHYELAELAVHKLKSANFQLKGHTEKEYEHIIISHLQSSTKIRHNLITQIREDEVEANESYKNSNAAIFGIKHKPEFTIGIDGTAIEIKVMTNEQTMRDILGQGIVYRMSFRFVILLFVDNTPDRSIVRLCRDKKSQEYSLLKGLSGSYNIMSVIGPLGQSKSLVFK